MRTRSGFLGYVCLALGLLILSGSGKAAAGYLTQKDVRGRLTRYFSANRDFAMRHVGQWFPRTMRWNIEVSKPDQAGYATYRATLKTPFVSAHVPLLSQITGKIYVVAGQKAALRGAERIRDGARWKAIGLSPAGAAYARGLANGRKGKSYDKYWNLRTVENPRAYVKAFQKVDFNKWAKSGMKPIALP